MNRQAFTLIELLVVIAVIVLLIGIIMPILHAARESANSVLCTSNIRQLSYAFTCYTMDNKCYPPGFDDTFPTNEVSPPGDYVGESPDDRMGWWWFHFLSPHMENDIKTLNYCPSRNINSFALADNPLCGNYGVNQSICKAARIDPARKEFTGAPLDTGDIANPTETLLLVDSGYSMINWWHVTKSPPGILRNTRADLAYIPGMAINSDKSIWPGQERDAVEGRHINRSVNIGFVDGHVAKQQADSLTVEKINDQSYKNLSPSWQSQQLIQDIP